MCACVYQPLTPSQVVCVFVVICAHLDLVCCVSFEFKFQLSNCRYENGTRITDQEELNKQMASDAYELSVTPQVCMCTCAV